MKILVTGGTGFIGSNLVKALTAKRKDVRCLIRNKSDITSLKGLKLETVKGDLTDRHSLPEATKGVEIVYHLAAVTNLLGGKIDTYQLVNVDGTRNILEACLTAGVKKFIYFSSIVAAGPSYGGVPLDENSPCHPLTPYGKSKYEAEKIVLQFFRDYKLPVVIIRPSNVYGPGGLFGYVPIFIKGVDKKIFFTIGSGNRLMSFCYIDNLIEAAILAEERFAPGQIYFISDERPHTFNELIETIAEEEKIKLFNLHIPLWVAYGFGYFLELLSKVWKSLPPVSRSSIKNISGYSWVCDISKVKKELGYLPNIELKEGIKRTVAWFRETGYIK